MTAGEFVEAMCFFQKAVTLWSSVAEETPAVYMDLGLAGELTAEQVVAQIERLEVCSAQ